MGVNFGNVIFSWQPTRQPCPLCSDPRNVVVNRERLVELLENVRKITHPDICSAETATAVTAKVNACLDAVKRWTPTL